mgnify:CR=1 FL=1
MDTKAYEKQRASIERSRQKTLAKMNSPEYKAKQLAQAQASRERSQSKQQDKMNCPIFREEQAAKAFASAKRQQARQIEKQLQKQDEQKRQKKLNAASYPNVVKQPKPLKRTPLKKATEPIKSKGLVGISRTKDEMELHDKMAALGCICCINKGLILPFSNSPTSIHHIDGRTKKDCHKKSLPLCAWHHDTPVPTELKAMYPDVFPLHAKGAEGGKKAWENLHGTQYELLEQVMEFINIHYCKKSKIFEQ